MPVIVHLQPALLHTFLSLLIFFPHLTFTYIAGNGPRKITANVYTSSFVIRLPIATEADPFDVETHLTYKS